MGPRGAHTALTTTAGRLTEQFFQLDLTGWWKDLRASSYIDSTRFDFFRCEDRDRVMFST